MMMKKCGVLGTIAEVLVIVGALNWGLVGAFDFNLVTALLGSWPMVVRVVYVLVGLGAIVMAAHLFGMCKSCCGASCKGGSCSGDSASGEASK
jgi:uncharacterized membrane protein YuzA (DUF378 family)